MFGFFIGKIVRLIGDHRHLSKTIRTTAASQRPLFKVTHLTIRKSKYWN